jgi:hypothetical protein
MKGAVAMTNQNRTANSICQQEAQSTRNGRRLRFESLEARWLFCADQVVAIPVEIPVEIDSGNGTVEVANSLAAVDNSSHCQNPTNRYDTNNDGIVTSLDALVAINDLNRNGPRPVPASDGESSSASFFVDVNGDEFISPADVLALINYLNIDPLDVDGSGSVDLADAGAVVEYLKEHGATKIPDFPNSNFEELSKLDSNRDGHITSADVLLIFNTINRSTSTTSDEAAEPILRNVNDPRDSIFADETLDSRILELLTNSIPSAFPISNQ